ncbi:hypothetical protein MTO96_028957 [Rhipicephalus appendiculatus]
MPKQQRVKERNPGDAEHPYVTMTPHWVLTSVSTGIYGDTQLTSKPRIEVDSPVYYVVTENNLSTQIANTGSAPEMMKTGGDTFADRKSRTVTRKNPESMSVQSPSYLVHPLHHGV